MGEYSNQELDSLVIILPSVRKGLVGKRASAAGTVYIINPAGQSNAVGPDANLFVGGSDDIVDSRVLMWSETGGGPSGDVSKQRQLLPFSVPCLFEYTNPPGVGPYVKFIKRLLATIGANDRIVVLCSARGGTAVYQGRWRTDGGGDLYNRMLAGFQNLIPALTAAYPGYSRKVYTLWQQGESDISIPITGATYKPLLRGVISGMRTVLASLGINDDIWLSAGMTPIYFGNYAALGVEFEQGQVEACTEEPRAFWVGGLDHGSTAGDTIHYDHDAMLDLGDLNFDKRDRAIFLTSSVPVAPSNPVINAEQISFGASDCGGLYAIEYRAVGSSGAWTRTKVHSRLVDNIGVTLTYNIPGTGDRDVRVFALSYAGDSLPSATVTYTTPSASLPTPLIKLDIANAPVDGSGNVTSIASIGSNTLSVIPESSAGTGATAVLTKTNVGGRSALALTVGKSLRATSNPIPAGGSQSFTALFAWSHDSPIASSSWLYAWNNNGGSDTTVGDVALGLANSGVNLKACLNSTTADLLSTGSLVAQNKNHCAAFVYDASVPASPTWRIDLNGVTVASGAAEVRSQFTQTNNLGAKFFGYGRAVNALGINGKAFCAEIYGDALTNTQVQTRVAQLAAADAPNGITAIPFG